MTVPAQPAGTDPVLDALGRSSALCDVGRTDEAEAVLRRALADAPDEPFLRTELARVLIVRGRHADALEQAERAVASAPGLGHAHAMRALALTGDPRRRFDAVDAARQAVALDPEDPFAHRTVARTALLARWFAAARAAAETAIELDPEEADGHVVLGSVLLQMDRPAEAEAAFREALRRDPEDAMALNDLGVAVQSQGRARGPEARVLFEAAARARPTDALARRNLAVDARSWVNGRWAWGLAIFFAARTLLDLGLGGAGAPIDAAIAAALVAFIVVRGRRRRAELSPSTQRLLREQRWWERPQLHLWRPWFWFIPAPAWLVVAAFVAVSMVVGLVARDEPPGPLWVGLALSLVVVAATGRRTWRHHGAAAWWARRWRSGS